MDKYLMFAERLAGATGRQLLAQFNSAEMPSRDSSIKTKFDFAADQLIISRIRKKFPHHSLLTEETGWIREDSKYLWIIDPIDGTGNFINHNPLFAISIALWENGKPSLGIIEAPFLGERYIAVKGKGAWKMDIRTGKKAKVHVSEINKMSDAYIIFCTGHKVSPQKSFKLVSQFYPKVKRLRQLGSAGIELAWVGTGRADAFILPGSFLWDIAAGILFVEEAGGRVLDFKGERLDYKKILMQENIDIVTANAKLQLPQKINY